MAKPKYLVGKPGDQKFKRNIPAKLQKLAGKTAFVERVRYSTASELKQKANQFAFKTDAELTRLGVSRQQPQASATLTAEAAQHFALIYFNSRHTDNLQGGAYFADPDEPGYTELLADAGDAVTWAIRAASGEVRMTQQRALRLLQEHGVLSRLKHDEDDRELLVRFADLRSDRSFQLLCRLMERADLVLAERRYEALWSGELPASRDELFGSPAPHKLGHTSAKPLKSIRDLKTLFMEQRGSSVTQSRQAQYKLPFRCLEEEWGSDFGLTSVTRELCREVVALLPTIPSHATQHYKNLTLRQAAERHELKVGCKAARFDEAQKHIQVFNSAFNLAVQEGWLDKNPWQGLSVAVPKGFRKKHEAREQTYEPFTVAHLNAIFGLPLFHGCVDDEHGCHTPGPHIVRRHRYWAPIIALWTGMRMNEILQLERADVAVSADGIDFIRVTDQDHADYTGTGFSKRVKTKNAVRSIPVHNMLKRIGFLKWAAEQPDGRLFPEATVGSAGEKPSDTYSKRFASNLRKAGVWKPRRLVFHSFRNSFNDALRDADAPLELREAINGWRAQRSMDERYGAGQALAKLDLALQRLSYPGLKTEHLLDPDAQS
ncbi:MAG: site-specific integrase [Rhizobiaceae bacterium]|nr:site-specific integrase [Rhizobiaceae bacterium]